MEELIIVGDAMCKPLWENLKVDNDYRLRDAWIRAKESHSAKENVAGLIEAGDKMADRMPALDDRMGIPLQYAWKYAKSQVK